LLRAINAVAVQPGDLFTPLAEIQPLAYSSRSFFKKSEYNFRVSPSFPQQWDRYVLLDHLASGGMADLYLAIQAQQFDRPRIVVIKRIRSAFLNSPDWQEMFKNEAQSLLCLNSPNLIQIFDLQWAGSEPFLVLEYIEGISFQSVLNRFSAPDESRSKGIPIAMVLDFLKQTCQGLQAAHEFRDPRSGKFQPILHRDLSPQNLLISSTGILKVIDFGIAKSELFGKGTIVASGMIKGKTEYISPEQFSKESPISAQSDLFSLGVILYESITGKKPLGDAVQIEVVWPKFLQGNWEIPKIASLRPDCPEALATLCETLLQRDPKKRPTTVRDILHSIQKIQSENKDSLGPDLKGFLETHFSDQIRDERARLQKLIDQAKNLKPIDPPAAGDSNISPSKIPLKWMVSLAAGICFIGIGIFTLIKSNSKSEIQSPHSAFSPITPKANEEPSSEAPPTTESGSDQRGPYSYLPAHQHRQLRKFFAWVNDLEKENSPQVQQKFLEASMRNEKLNNPALHRKLRAMNEEVAGRILTEAEQFVDAIKAANTDEKKLSIITHYRATLELMPLPPRMLRK